MKVKQLKKAILADLGMDGAAELRLYAMDMKHSNQNHMEEEEKAPAVVENASNEGDEDEEEEEKVESIPRKKNTEC